MLNMSRKYRSMNIAPLFRSDMRYGGVCLVAFRILNFWANKALPEDTPGAFDVNFRVTQRIQGGSFQPQNNQRIKNQGSGLTRSKGQENQEQTCLSDAWFCNSEVLENRITTSPKDKFIETLDHHCWSFPYTWTLGYRLFTSACSHETWFHPQKSGWYHPWWHLGGNRWIGNLLWQITWPFWSKIWSIPFWRTKFSLRKKKNQPISSRFCWVTGILQWQFFVGIHTDCLIITRRPRCLFSVMHQRQRWKVMELLLYWYWLLVSKILSSYFHKRSGRFRNVLRSHTHTLFYILV